MFFFYDDMTEEPRKQYIKIQRAQINRDYSVNACLNVDFSIFPISVIYGENGCGKTTFLRLLNAFFAQSSTILSQEKVSSMTVWYETESDKNSVTVKREIREEEIRDEFGEPILQVTEYYDWTEVKNSAVSNMSSILFGVNRGLTNNHHISEDEIFNSIIRSKYAERFRNRDDIMVFSHLLKRNLEMNQRSRRGRNIKNKYDFSDPVLTIDDISMDVIEELLVNRYIQAKSVSTAKVQKALFDTLAEACDSLSRIDIDMDDLTYQELLSRNRERLIMALQSGESNPLSERITEILRNSNKISSVYELGNNELLKKLIVNMSNELDDASVFLQSINRLTEIFNEYIGPEKYLSITENAAVIRFHHSKEHHGIGSLSSGERHLLVLLTIFVIEGDDRDVFMVDEPEISLNMVWQKKLLPLLHELAPNSQIIVASHSPSVARNNTNYLVELR